MAKANAHSNKAEQKGNKPKTKRKPARSKVHKPKYSFYMCPEGMSQEDWQRALRRQTAEKSVFEITPLNDVAKPGYYNVRRAVFERIKLGDDENKERCVTGFSDSHTVVYRGAGSQWNYCSCMDFRTSGLGTCKHIEAVKMWIRKKRRALEKELPSATSLYVDYKGYRRIRLRIGSEMHEEIINLAKDYFASDGEVLPGKEESVPQFVQKAKGLLPSFRCYDDVYELIGSRNRQQMLLNLNQNTSDETIQTLVKTHLYPYQLEGVRFAFSHGRSINADEMGLGKTIQAITTAELLKHHNLITSVLVVCPTSLKYQWKREIERFTNSTAEIVEGNPLRRKAIYDSIGSFYKIVSYNAMCNDIKLHSELTADMLIMDEVQRLKNWDTNIAKAARHIKSDYTLILSGTPLENKLEELYSVMELIDQFALAPYYKFRSNYIITDDTGMTIGYKNLNEIGNRLKSLLLRRRKKDVALQMPERQDKMLYVPMTSQQTEIHEEFAYKLSILVNKWRAYHYLGEQDRQRIMLLLSQMRMVANSTYILDQKTRHDTKIDEARNILQDVLASGDEKVVVFSCWERMTRLIGAELEQMGIAYESLNGGVPSEKRGKMVERFMTDPECRVFISTDAGATGLNLQAASVIINMELPWNPAVLEQRIGRIYRLGQRRNIQVVNLVSKDSFEEQIEEKIHFKTALFEGILDNGRDSISLSDKSTFEQLMESLETIVEDKEVAQTIANDDNEETRANDTIPLVEELDPIIKEDVETAVFASPAPAEPSESPTQERKDSAQLIENGFSFLSQLAETLKSEEKTTQLVETLVKTDKETGQTTLQIPVPDKSSVTNVLQMFGKILSGMSGK